ncbi:hypothetical protein [Streptomyces sp. NPDC101181]|uniref:hypothetical protein n=1 Tax=Streptomyces sp. NPDC101181 TaxID=3366125 RepID=UPI0037F24A32
MSDWMPETGTPETRTPPVSTPGEPDAPQDAQGLPGAGEGEPPSSEPAEPAPLGVGRTPTGRDEVDGLLERLADADHLPADGHIAVYEDVHGGLRSALTSLDGRPAVPGPSGTPAPPAYDRTHDHRS